MGSGTNMALPIYAEFLTRVYADSTLGISMEDEFERPLDFFVDMNCPDISETSSSGFDDF
jgi:penicillin-binding protein 1A